MRRALFDKKVNRIAPYFVSVMLWMSLIVFLLFVDLAVIPHSHRDDDVFPYNTTVVIEDMVTSVNGIGLKETTTLQNSENEVTDGDSSIPIGGTDGKPIDESSQVNTEGEKSLQEKFLVVFIGLPGGRVNNLNIAFGIILMVLSGIFTARYSRFIGGLPAVMVTFGVGSLICSKIFFWLSDPTTRALFIATRVLESAILIFMAARLKRFHTDFLAPMGSMFAILASLAFSLTMMASEPQLVLGTSVLLPLWIILMAIPILPLIRGSLQPREAMFRKIELWLVAVAPFCLAVLFNWWFHISWLGDIDIPKVSYKNTLVIYLLGLVFGCFLLLLKYLPFLKTNRFSWPLVLLVLALITHIALMNHVVSHYILASSS
jgi:hypothetical protein